MRYPLVALLCAAPLAAQAPAGLARAALDNPAFTWLHVPTRELRLYFLADSYPAMHRDSLATLAAAGRARGLRLLGVEDCPPIDVFFIETRAQMDALVGLPVTGFAQRDARAVFLVTNPEWRAFERHELMHVLAHHVWGAGVEPSAWIVEGLAQFTDGRCGAYTVDDVAHGLGRRSGFVALDTLVTRFRALNDLTAYLQAASMVGYLYETRGLEGVRAVWQQGTEALPPGFAAGWQRWLRTRAQPVPSGALDSISQKGCG